MDGEYGIIREGYQRVPCNYDTTCVRRTAAVIKYKRKINKKKITNKLNKNK